MTSFDLDIIFVNYNSTDDLIACLRSLQNGPCQSSYRVLIQDNASHDAPRRLTELFPGINLAINKKNIGLGRAINQAAARSDAPFIALLNPDSYIGGDCIDECLQWLREHPDVGALGPSILNDDGTPQGSARAFPNAMTAFFGRSSLLSRLFPNNRFTAKNVLNLGSDIAEPMEVDWVSLAALFVRREAFEKIGMMDEDFFLFWEDADLCTRFWRHGWKVVYYPHSSVIHKIGGSRKSRGVASLWNFHKSTYLFYKKHARGLGALASPLVFILMALRFFLVCPLQMMRHGLDQAKNKD